jgi:hypothetical protein
MARNVDCIKPNSARVPVTKQIVRGEYGSVCDELGGLISPSVVLGASALRFRLEDGRVRGGVRPCEVCFGIPDTPAPTAAVPGSTELTEVQNTRGAETAPNVH